MRCTLQTETFSTVFWNCLCRRPGLSATLAMSSKPTGLPQRKCVGQKNSAGSAVRPEVVGWRIWDAAETWLWSVGGRSWLGTWVLSLSNSCAPCRWACTQLAWIYRANAAECAVAATSLDRTFAYHWQHRQQHWALVVACPSSLSANPQRQRYSSRRTTTRNRERVWPLMLCPVTADSAVAGRIASRGRMHWQWRRVCGDPDQTAALHPVNGRGRGLQ